MAQIGIGLTLENVRLSYFGHVVRGEGLEKAVMLGIGSGSRSRGRPKKKIVGNGYRTVPSAPKRSG